VHDEKVVHLALKASEALVRMLADYGVNHVFGVCGDTSLDLYEAFSAQSRIRHVLTRDERSASYMADVYARVSGKVGVCEGPSGGGALYLAPGVAEADKSCIALIAINTDVPLNMSGRYTLTELDQKALFDPLCKWSAVVVQSERLPAILREAFKRASSGVPGAVHLALPMDILKQRVPDKEVYSQPEFGMFPASPPEPSFSRLQRVAQLILKSEFPVILAGGGVLTAKAWKELTSLAETAGIPVATSISGKGSISETHPFSIGVVGSNGGVLYRHEIVRNADLVLILGCRADSTTTEDWSLFDNKTKIVQIDIDPNVIGLNCPVELGVVGDVKLSLEILNKILAGKVEAARVAKIAGYLERHKQAFRKQISTFISDEAVPVTPERFIAEFSQLLPKNSVIIADVGTPCPYISAYWLQPEPGRRFICPRSYGALGYALPGVIGAYYANPDLRLIAVMGEGGLGMALGELETLKRLSIPAVIININNKEYSWVRAHQKATGRKLFGTDFSFVDYAEVARGFGIHAKHVRDPATLRSTLREALTFEEPFLIDVVMKPLGEVCPPVTKWGG